MGKAVVTSLWGGSAGIQEFRRPVREPTSDLMVWPSDARASPAPEPAPGDRGGAPPCASRHFW